MIKFTYSCNNRREDIAYCEKGDEDSILAGWNRLGKTTGHSYVMLKTERADNVKNYDFRRLGSSKQFVRNTHDYNYE